MKKINPIYIIAILLIVVMGFMAVSMQTNTASFYGFAENKETEINHIDDVLVMKIHVENGQEVKKGDLLIEVENAELPSRIDGLKLEKELIKENLTSKKTEIRDNITRIQMDRDFKLKEIEGKIEVLEKEIALKTSLYDGLKTIDNGSSGTNLDPDVSKLNLLKQNRIDVSEKAAEEIKMQRKQLSALSTPTELRSNLIETELAQFEQEKNRLLIYAPSDGLIGNVTCKEGENISAFSTLMNFYKHNPTLVKGFVHESMILEVQVGDELEVSSSLHSDHKIKGVVSGLGSRIVEIPERLRKIAEFKTYGREVLIKIPAENDFLQKEKVLLNTISSESRLGFGNLFTSKKHSSKLGEESSKEIKE